MRILVAALICSACLCRTTGAVAEPVAYALEAARSEVGFTVAFGPDRITGTMPVTAADVVLDFDRASNSRVQVTLDASGAQASFAFATQAMRGPKVLATGSFPSIRFASREVRATGSGNGSEAEVRGDITIRGVTRPITLRAEVYRQRDAPEDLSRLSVLLTGVVRRSEFGAAGWNDMVGDEVSLRILARVARKE